MIGENGGLPVRRALGDAEAVRYAERATGGDLGRALTRWAALAQKPRLYIAGGFPVFELPFGRVGMQVCYDILFPESSRSLVLGGAQLVLSPGNFVRNFRRRAYDERGSIIVGWEGWPLAGPGSADGAELLIAEMDLAEATPKRQRNPEKHGILDRGPDAYRTEAARSSYRAAAEQAEVVEA